MRNLKRALSLAVASVMLLGMMVVGTSAAYDDVASTDNVEAIGVLQMVGVMSGDENGNFNPNKGVTRNEMAVIMANLMDLDVADYAGSTPFTDLADWAEPYVAACYANGIVSGTSATTYGGNGTVTTAQAGLMVMKALGYFQYASDFEDDWMVATVKQASKIDLFDGVASKATANLTRNDVAQLVLNALECNLVEPTGTPGTVIEGNGLTITTGSSVSYGNVTPAKLLMADLYGTDLVKNDTTAIDNMGRPAVEWTYTNKGETDSVKVAKEAALTYVIEKDSLNTLAEIIAEEELTVATGATYYASNNAYSNTYAAISAVELPYGRIVEIFKDADKKVSKVVTYDYSIVEITKVEAYDEEDAMVEDYEASVLYTVKDLAGTELAAKEYVDNLKESKTGYQAIGKYAKGDVLAVVLKNDGTMLVKEAAKTVDGVKTAFGTGYIKVDGTQYILQAGTTVAANYDDTWTYYLDPKGTIIDGELKEAAEAALEYVYVLAEDADTTSGLLNGTSKKAAVKVMYLDGTVETVNYEVIKADKAYTVPAGNAEDQTGTGGTANTIIDKGDYYFNYNGEKFEFVAASDFTGTVATGAWASYTKNEAGEITLKSATKTDVSDTLTVDISEDDRTITSTVYANTNTKVTVLDADGVSKTYTGYKNFPAQAGSPLASVIAGPALVIFGDKNTVAAEVYVYDASYTPAAEKVDVVMFVSTGDTVKDGTVVNFYEAGKKVTYTVTTDMSLATAGQLYSLTKADDGTVSATLLVAGTDYEWGKISVVSDDYIVADGVEYALNDCETYLVNADRDVMGEAELAVDAQRDAAVFFDADGAYLVIIYKYVAP